MPKPRHQFTVSLASAAQRKRLNSAARAAGFSTPQEFVLRLLIPYMTGSMQDCRQCAKAAAERM